MYNNLANREVVTRDIIEGALDSGKYTFSTSDVVMVYDEESYPACYSD